MRRFIPLCAGALTAVAILPVAAPSSAVTPTVNTPVWTLDRVVVVMRHGVRPPTKAEPLPSSIAGGPWPKWDVGWGELSHHGEQAVALLGAFDRAQYASLLGSGCPAVRAVADTDQRTVRTAEVYVAALLPGCSVGVEHEAAGESDPRFSPPADPTPAANDRALAAANDALPQGGTTKLDQDLSEDWTAIDRILDCRVSACIASHPTTLSTTGGEVKLGGALELGGSFSETLALEYADGKQMSEVGWGRVTRDGITHLLELHSREFALKARPPMLARTGASALLDQVATALSSPSAPVFSVFVGHDTNLALIGGALGLHWHAAQFAPDDPPPGGALIFERWRNASGTYRLSIRFRSQSLDEMRNLTPPGTEAMQTLAFSKCDSGQGCDAPDLREVITLGKSYRRLH